MKARIISPSAPSTHTPERTAQFEAGLKNLEALEVECRVMPHARNALSFVADTAENRLRDLLDAYKEEGDVVIAANGGWNAGDLIQDMEWEAMRANPKPLCGFSDITVLLNAAYVATHQVQIHGPMVTWGFHNNDELTNVCFLKAVKEKSYELPFERVGKFLRGRTLEGIGVGGNLVTLESLLGTPYEPDWRGKILFWEETEEPLHGLLRSLIHFKNAGVWEKIGGMIIGHLDQIEGRFAGTFTEPLEAIMKHLVEYDFPILKTELFGHGMETNICLPVGGKIKADEERVFLSFL